MMLKPTRRPGATLALALAGLALAGLALAGAFAGGCGEAREEPRSSAGPSAPGAGAGSSGRPAALVFTAPG